MQEYIEYVDDIDAAYPVNYCLITKVTLNDLQFLIPPQPAVQS